MVATAPAAAFTSISRHARGLRTRKARLSRRAAAICRETLPGAGWLARGSRRRRAGHRPARARVKSTP